MKIAENWQDYKIIATGDGYKLERWKDVVLLRPDPQVIWKSQIDLFSYPGINAVYRRSDKGGGAWEYRLPMPDAWEIAYRDLRFKVKPMGFKHTGLFPEQAVNWDWMRGLVKKAPKPFRALNLFAYTGGATCALAAAGAEVVHVDAAKGMVAWAKENLALCGLGDKPVRFIVDDVMKFVLREQRRGRQYEGILMDPPSYGRGPGGEMWKIEENLYPLVAECCKLLSPEARFFLINSYTTGLAPTVLSNVLQAALPGRGGRIEAGEVGLPISRGTLVLPCGASGRWYR